MRERSPLYTHDITLDGGADGEGGGSPKVWWNRWGDGTGQGAIGEVVGGKPYVRMMCERVQEIYEG